ncbi:MAG: CPBP family intramembrane metalloprotease [Nitrososphaerota archaeon]|nr:CPBP family intramembrane metalloprotease [Nitrososphaerota archaeon]MDG6974125.1 CPBP family intramembrane metalloprotease [Nitrososphaerota archaeon]MDG6987295.1 CPBP family intramembrane metalloprotease [Nitrososphaerota archaeon]MDG7015421.1 CPBP family intramembrane metalloprotease [Nitrososphaerota archaeon]WGO50165.1 MAG: CPBP family intramembrane metalloprotease [Nitrososphaerota archaeon]
MDKKQPLRFVTVIVVGLGFAYFGNQANYFASYFERVVFAEGGLLGIALFALWNSSSLGKLQRVSKRSLAELAVLAFYYVLLLVLLPKNCNVLQLCIGSGNGGTVQPATLQGYVALVASWAIVATAEETFSRGYVITEFLHNSGNKQSVRFSVLAMLVSTGVFLLLHVFVIAEEAHTLPMIEQYANTIIFGGLVLSATYVVSEGNLTLCVMEHFFYDAIVPVFAFTGSQGGIEVGFIMVFLVPVVLVYSVHRFRKMIPTDSIQAIPR